MDQWTGLPDDTLATAAQQGPHAQIEAMRRLRVAIDKATEKNEIYLRRMFWLNVTLATITFLLTIVAVSTVVQALVVIKGWFS
jgi:uncharacterized membrane protein